MVAAFSRSHIGYLYKNLECSYIFVPLSTQLRVKNTFSHSPCNSLTNYEAHFDHFHYAFCQRTRNANGQRCCSRRCAELEFRQYAEEYMAAGSLHQASGWNCREPCIEHG